MGHPRPFFRLFSSFQTNTTILTTNIREKMSVLGFKLTTFVILVSSHNHQTRAPAHFLNLLTLDRVNYCSKEVSENFNSNFKSREKFTEVHGMQYLPKGAFTQSILRGVIRRRLGHLKNKKYFFQSINDHFMPRNTPQCERYFS